jgi:hypothetical protein
VIVIAMSLYVLRRRIRGHIAFDFDPGDTGGPPSPNASPVIPS